MLFDLHPKESPESLFGRDNDLTNIIKHIINRRWVALLGTRMVGKTSLVKATKCKLDREGIETLYINLWGTSSLIGFLDGIIHSLNKSPTFTKKMKKLFSRIDSLKIGPGGISISNNKKPASLIWNILSVLGENERDLIIFLDEVQELGYVTVHLVKILANIFSVYPNITFCFTGSYFGLVKSLLEPQSDSALYGRSPARISISSFSKTTSRNFLIAGFKECNTQITEKNISEVVDRFNGIPGWLTLYGNSVTISGLSHKAALLKTEKEAFKIQRSVLNHYFAGRDQKTHLAALKAIAVQATWSEIRGSIEALTGKKLNDASLKNILRAMNSAFLIEKINSTYRVTDPVLRRFILTGSYLREG